MGRELVRIVERRKANRGFLVFPQVSGSGFLGLITRRSQLGVGRFAPAVFCLLAGPGVAQTVS